MDDISFFYDKHKDEPEIIKADDSDSDSESGGAIVYPEVLEAFPVQRPKLDEFHDTSLDHYIPCFVKKIPGMKPFLIDVKVTKKTNYATQRDFGTNGGSFREFNNSQSNNSTSHTSYARQQHEGSFRDFNNSYSTNSTSSYARQRDFGTKDESFRDFNNSYPATSSGTASYARQRDFTSTGGSFRDFTNSHNHSTANTTSSHATQHDLRINEGPFRDFNNSGAGTSDFVNNSHRGSWSFNPEEIRAASSYQQVRGGNNYRNNYGNNYRNNYGNNDRNNNYANNNNYNTNTSNNYNNYSNKSHQNNNYEKDKKTQKKDLLIRGPRSAKGQENSAIQKEEYNKKDFVVNYEKARFFMIKSFSENDVYNSVKYNVWSSTLYGNKKLDSVYRESMGALNAEGESENCPIFLFFSVNSSGQFVGLAEMTGLVDFEKKMDFWQQDRWDGFFPVKWHIIKDIPNFKFRNITLQNNENKVVTFSRDTQEILLPQGLKMLEIFKEFEAESSLLDDFEFYEEKEKVRWENKNEASGSNDDLFDDLSMDFLEEEMRRMDFRSPKRYY